MYTLGVLARDFLEISHFTILKVVLSIIPYHFTIHSLYQFLFYHITH